jgi:hypothetical protein
MKKNAILAIRMLNSLVGKTMSRKEKREWLKRKMRKDKARGVR